MGIIGELNAELGGDLVEIDWGRKEENITFKLWQTADELNIILMTTGSSCGFKMSAVNWFQCSCLFHYGNAKVYGSGGIVINITIAQMKMISLNQVKKTIDKKLSLKLSTSNSSSQEAGTEGPLVWGYF